jgi:hypothetical protein
LSFVDDWSDKASDDDEVGMAEGDGDSTTGPAVAASKPKKQAKASNVAAKRKSHLNIVFIGHVGKYFIVLFFNLTTTVNLQIGCVTDNR